MTIVVSSSRAATLAAAGQENNPFLTPAPLTGTYSTVTGTEVLAVANAFTGTTFDKWSATPASGIAAARIVFSGNQSPTFVGIAAHSISEVSGTVRVQYSTDSGSTWNDSGAGPVTPTDNQAIGFRFEGVTADYWRINITGLSGDVDVGVIWIGSEIIIPQRIYQGYAPPLTPNMLDLRTNVSEGGELLGGAFTSRGSGWSAEFQHISPSFLRGATWLAFQDRWNKGYGSFWGWRPDKYGDLFYSWRSGGLIAPQNSGPTEFMSVAISARAHHE